MMLLCGNNTYVTGGSVGFYLNRGWGGTDQIQGMGPASKVSKNVANSRPVILVRIWNQTPSKACS